MIENFNEIKKYKLILNEINGEEKSITGIQKSLEEKGINMHRLVLTGYLNAMVELGILKEKEIKPARIFSFTGRNKHDIYSIVGSSMKKLDEENAGYNSLLILHYLLERPVFTRELEKSNVNVPTKNVRAINSQYRNDYTKKLSEIDIKIPPSSMLIEPVDVDKVLVTRLLNFILYNEYDLKKYMVVNTNQKTLD
jgi:DNA-binding HxlR family transcriptional regulator